MLYTNYHPSWTYLGHQKCYEGPEYDLYFKSKVDGYNDFVLVKWGDNENSFRFYTVDEAQTCHPASPAYAAYQRALRHGKIDGPTPLSEEDIKELIKEARIELRVAFSRFLTEYKQLKEQNNSLQKENAKLSKMIFAIQEVLT